jgi:hypothetical protein
MHLTKCKQNFANNSFRWDEESSATEVPTEMVQTPLVLAAPPSSPNFPPSKCFITLSDAQELAKAVMDIQIGSAHAPKCTCSHTPPEDPSEAASSDLCPTPPPTAADKVESEEPKARASTLEFKKVNEVYICRIAFQPCQS